VVLTAGLADVATFVFVRPWCCYDDGGHGLSSSIRGVHVGSWRLKVMQSYDVPPQLL
jgi:hypothetical protein